MNNGVNNICNNCVMDNTDSRIVFDNNGICDHCNTFYSEIEPKLKSNISNKNILYGLLKNIQKEGKNKEFDCILGMSGGIDSSYLLYLAKEEFNLRPLVFHVDAGWNTQLAVNNIEKLVDGLGLDLYTQVIDWEEMKDLQVSYFRSGVPHIDVPQDHAFFSTMYRFASRYNVKHILTGGNYSTECIRNPVEWMYYQSDSIQLKAIHKAFGSVPLRNFPTTKIIWHKLYLPYLRGIRVHRLLDLIHYNKKEAMNLLMDKFGWQPYPQKHFESRFTRFYESYWLYERFGYDVRKVQFSSLILTGQMSRDEALSELAKLPYDISTIHQEFEFVAHKLGITVDELRGYFNMPKKTYLDYKSQQHIYAVGARIFRALGLEKGGKR